MTLYRCCYHCDWDCIGKYHPHDVPCKVLRGGRICLVGSMGREV